MIVVVGGSGTLGRLVVSALQTAGHPVRALVRDATKARASLGRDVDIVAADLREPATLEAPLRGASAVVSAAHGFLGGRGDGPAEVDREGNAHLVGMAADSGAHVILISVAGAAADSALDLARMKYAAERNLIESGTPWTIVRPAPFLETWVGLMQRTAGRSGRPLVPGRGQQAMAFVSAEDVATLVVAAVHDPSMRGRILEVCGPERLTLTQLAQGVQTASGSTASPRHIPGSVLRVLATLAPPVGPRLARQSRAALLMDNSDLSRNASPLHTLLPDSPSTSVATILPLFSSSPT